VGFVPGERSYTLQISHAVCKSRLPPHLRHLLLTLALLADSRTGTGYHGQPHIAKAMGVSDKTLRKYFTELEALDRGGATPVRITRQRQGRPDGTGRSSDKWTLVPIAEEPQTEASVPFEVGEDDEAQTEHFEGSNGTQSSDDRRDRSSATKPEAPPCTAANETGPGLHSPAALGQLSWDVLVDEATRRSRRRRH